MDSDFDTEMGGKLLNNYGLLYSKCRMNGRKIIKVFEKEPLAFTALNENSFPVTHRSPPYNLSYRYSLGLLGKKAIICVNC